MDLINLRKLRSLCERLVKSVIPGTPMSWENVALAASIAFLPLFFLTIKNWTETCLVIMALISAYGIWKSGLKPRDFFPDRETAWIFIALMTPLVGNVLVFLLRGDLRLGMLRYDWDFINGPSRIAMAGIAFLWMRHQGVRFTETFRIICPLSIIFIPFFLHGGEGGAGIDERFCTKIIDVDNISMQVALLGSFVFLSLLFDPLKDYKMTILNIVAIASAIYVAIASQGRGGWIAAPVIIIMAILLHRGPKIALVKVLLIGLICLAVAAPFSKALVKRSKSIYTEYQDWRTGRNQDTASGARLTMWKISWQLIKERPMLGYGHRDVLWGPVYSVKKEVYCLPQEDYTSRDKEYARMTLCRVGPHNQLFSDLLRGGLLTLSSTLAFILIPLTLFLMQWKRASRDAQLALSMGIMMIACFLVFCITQSPLGLKVFWSFYGFLVAAISAQALSSGDTKKLQQAGAVQTT